MKLYIAGPMRGIPLYNFPAFFRCAIALRLLGHETINPAEVDMADGFDPGKTLEEQDFVPADALRKDFLSILSCGGIVMLPDWGESSFAPLERAVAQSTGLLVFDYNPGARFGDVLTPADCMGRIQVNFNEIGTVVS